MDSTIRFWYGLGSPSGSRGYSDWIAHAAFARAQVSGDTALFAETADPTHGTRPDANGDATPAGANVRAGRNAAPSSRAGANAGTGAVAGAPPDADATLLDAMIKSFTEREADGRVDLVNAKQHFEGDYPRCLFRSDGYDAMEESISGNGCRPSNNAMYYGNALAIAKIAAAMGKATVAADWGGRAQAIREMYLGLLWNDDVNFFSVYKDGSPARRGQANDTNGLPFGFPDNVCGWPNNTAKPAPPPPGPPSEWWRYRINGCPPATSWHNDYQYVNKTVPCNATVEVRELLGLGPPWYFEVPDPAAGAGGLAKYVRAWEQLFDEQGFKAKWGPTTAERRHRCFNFTGSTHECNWAGPSWPCVNRAVQLVVNGGADRFRQRIYTYAPVGVHRT